MPARTSTWVERACKLAAVEGPFPDALADVHAEFERIHPFLDGNGRAEPPVLPTASVARPQAGLIRADVSALG